MVKECPICGNTIAESIRVCLYCGYDESLDHESYPTLQFMNSIYKTKAILKREYADKVQESSLTVEYNDDPTVSDSSDETSSISEGQNEPEEQTIPEAYPEPQITTIPVEHNEPEIKTVSELPPISERQDTLKIQQEIPVSSTNTQQTDTAGYSNSTKAEPIKSNKNNIEKNRIIKIAVFAAIIVIVVMIVKGNQKNTTDVNNTSTTIVENIVKDETPTPTVAIKTDYKNETINIAETKPTETKPTITDKQEVTYNTSDYTNSKEINTDWKAAYLEEVEKYERKSEQYNTEKYALAYIDDDEIPELILGFKENDAVVTGMGIYVLFNGIVDYSVSTDLEQWKQIFYKKKTGNVKILYRSALYCEYTMSDGQIKLNNKTQYDDVSEFTELMTDIAATYDSPEYMTYEQIKAILSE